MNPSFALTMNRYGFVLEAAPYNDDGAAILQNIDVRCQSWEQAVRLLLDEMIRQGYLAPDGLVSVTVQSGNGNTEQKILGEIRESVDPSASYEQCAEHSISEIKELTEGHCGGHHGENGTDAGVTDESHKPVQESMDHHGRGDEEEHR